jgi:hypothetical protein
VGREARFQPAEQQSSISTFLLAGMRCRKIGLVPRLLGALYSNFCKIDILKFQKKIKKYKDVVNYIHYESANFYYEIPCIATLAKKTK